MRSDIPFADLPPPRKPRRRSPSRRRRRLPKPPSFLRQAFWGLMKAVLIVAAPFVLLIRGAVLLHNRYHWHAWPAVAAAVLATALLLLIYFAVVQQRLGRDRGDKIVWRRRFFIALLLVGTYSLYGLLYLSADHAKDAAVRAQFHDLNPILRLGVSTAVMFDRSLLITDASRLPEDYRRMGLPTARHSLHYRQSNGYTHAIDLRTRHRSWVRNQLLRLFFAALGFNTLRHVGTADHLHVSLSSHDRPGAI